MAESTLTALLSDIEKELNRFLFGSRSAPADTGDEAADIQRAIDRGIRQFLYPPILTRLQERVSHRWSFLQTWTTINIFGDFSGSITSVADPSKLTDTAADFQPDTADTGAELVGQTVVVKDVSAGTTTNHTISAVDSSTVLSITPNLGAGIIATDTYTIQVDANYNLPDDLGGIRGQLKFQTRTGYPPVEVTSPHRIERLRMDTRNTRKFRPRFAAVRPRQIHTSTADESSGVESARFELMLWPVPDASYVLEYAYDHLIDKVRDDDGGGPTNYPHVPPGGLVHSETIMASCLAIAEEYGDTPATRYRDLFMQRLEASVSLDRQLTTAEVVGYNEDNSDLSSRRHEPFLDVVTVNGVQYP